MSFWIYMLHCADDSYYIGHTDNLERRVRQHQSREIPGCYTASRLPVKLVFSQEFTTREEALISERQIKGWSRAKKKALILADWAEISRLARGRDNHPVRPELPVRAEPVEARPSTGSGRTEFKERSGQA